jgi:hypothetical protein
MSPADPALGEGRFTWRDRSPEFPSLRRGWADIARVASDPQAAATVPAGVKRRDRTTSVKVSRLLDRARDAVSPNGFTAVSGAVVPRGFASVRVVALAPGAARPRAGGIRQDTQVAGANPAGATS